jgi:hypothetical protein
MKRIERMPAKKARRFMVPSRKCDSNDQADDPGIKGSKNRMDASGSWVIKPIGGSNVLIRKFTALLHKKQSL